MSIFVTGEKHNFWREENEWPLKRAKEQKLYLKSKGKANSLYGTRTFCVLIQLGNGELSFGESFGENTDSFVFDPKDPGFLLVLYC